MKIKSVKIAGFRAFEKVEDATFDFTKGDEIMNFASIYAPNGFGKTSFYDAVEWGITHKIQRFDRMVDFEKVRKENSAPLLLNKGSQSGQVIIETTNLNPFKNVINKRKKYDFKATAENEYFQKQFLSQDLIDAFLKEEKAEDRYSKFLDIDKNLKKYDSAYKKINTLLGYIKDERKDLINSKRKEEDKIKSDIDFEQELKKFEEIKQVITSLNELDESLDPIDQNTFNQTSYDNLSRTIEVRLFSLEEELNKAKLRIEKIIFARDGEKTDDNKIGGGLRSYLENKSEIIRLDAQIKELDNILGWFEKQEKLQNESKFIDENLSIQQNSLEKALKIDKKFETFHSIQKEIDNLTKEIIGNTEALLKIKKEKSDVEKNKSDKTIKLNNLKKSLESNIATLNNIPTQQKHFEETSIAFLNSQKNNLELSESIALESKKLGKTNAILDDFKYYENKISEDIELLLEFSFFNEHKDLVTNYISENQKLENLKKDIQNIQIKIDNQNLLNKELQEFINTGLELVNKYQSSDCPLCNQNYESFEKLSENILSNKLFNNQLKIYLEEKVEIETRLNNVQLKLSESKIEIEKLFSLIKQPYVTSFENTEKLILKLNSQKKNISEELNRNQLILNEFNSLLGDSKTFNELTNKIQDDILKTENQIFELSGQINILDNTLVEKETLIKSIIERLNIGEQNLLNLQNSKVYKEFREYFFEELKSNVIDKSLLSDYISNFKENQNSLINKKEILNQDLEELKLKLSNHTLAKDDYIKKTQEINKVKSLILRVFESYENFILSEFGIKIGDKDKSQIEEVFFDLIEQQKKVLIQVEYKIERYNILNILNKACLEATESKKIQDEINKINESIKKLGIAEKALNNEKESLKIYLKETIEAYFYTPLINAIYTKIDPHPDYNKIEFECVFGEKEKDKPRLQIYTIDNNGIKSIPSLYFSTAQVNILSLSIFLARALKTTDDDKKPIDCIFIDDPIQSMDSINILSFIDLFRGITLALDKQLIVSTHEENFHLLLQKKIPSELFKSKFIEFETFGKLKHS